MTLTTVAPIFPDFAPGQSGSRVYPIRFPGWSVKETKQFNNFLQRSVGGKSSSVKYWSDPLRMWEFNYPVLFDDPSMATHGANGYYQGFPIPYTDYQILEGFVTDMQGQGNQFLFQPPGSAVGGTANITAISGSGNYFTIFAANSFTPGLYASFASLGGATFLNGQTLQILAATPSQFTVYFVHATYAFTAEASVPVFAGQLLNPVDANNNTELRKQTGGYPIIPLSGTPWATKAVTEAVQVIDSSSLVVKANGSTYSTFTLAPADSVAPYLGLVLQCASTPATPITAAFNYFHPCRFPDDSQEYENFMAMLWAVGSFKFQQDRL